MPKKRELNPQSLFEPDAVLSTLCNNDIKTSHAFRLWKFLLKHKADVSIHECPDLPVNAKKILSENFATLTTRVEQVNNSLDGSTSKLLIRLQDGGLVETVIMRYDGGNKMAGHGNRNTVCVSSQVGCQMGCSFCATGTMGLSGNLTTGEILEQLVHANRIERIRNVVFMGMGEPLDNYQAVVNAIRMMIDVRMFSLKSSRICISTVGVVPKMRQLHDDLPGVQLALSLHAPNQDLRCQIVPSAKAFPIEKLMQAVDERLDLGYRLMVEYILIGNVNDSAQTARELGTLLQGKNVIVNLIPYNPTDVFANYQEPTSEAIIEFSRILYEEFKLSTTVRRTMGQDIAGACGQLVVDKKADQNSEVPDIEDLGDTKPIKRKKLPKAILKSTTLTVNDQKPYLTHWVITTTLLLLLSMWLGYYAKDALL